MLNILRRLRRKGIFKTQYLKYAVGEIFLVMVGILLALQVNNWNEERLESKRGEKLLNELEKAMDFRYILYDKTSRSSFETDSLFSLVLSDTLKREDYLKEQKLRKILINLPITELDVTSFLSDVAISKVIENEPLIPSEYDSLLYYLKLQQSSIISLSKTIQVIREYRNQSELDLIKEHPYLLLDDSVSIEKTIEYALTDEVYKARVIGLRKQVIPSSIDFNFLRTVFNLARTEFKIRVRAYTKAQVDSLWRASSYRHADLLDCNSDLMPSEQYNSYYYAIMYNSTESPIDIEYYSDLDQFMSKDVLSPGELDYTFWQDNISIRVNSGNECLGKAILNRDQYLIF